MPTLPYYPMFANDFNMDVLEWTNEEVGIYIRLLNYSWVNGSIPADATSIARVSGADPATCPGLWPVHLASKWVRLTDTGGGEARLVNEYQERIRLEVAEKGAFNKERAKRAAVARWGQKEVGDTSDGMLGASEKAGKGMLEECQSKSHTIYAADAALSLPTKNMHQASKDSPPEGAVEPYRKGGRGWLYGTAEDMDLARRIHVCLELRWPKVFSDSMSEFNNKWGALWADSIRKMRKSMKLTLDDIWEMFWWAHNDVDESEGDWPGWSEQIRSPRALKDKWDLLTIRREGEQRHEKTDRRKSAGEELDRQLAEASSDTDSGTVRDLREGKDGFVVESDDGDLQE